MKTEEIMEQILSTCPEVSKEQILEKLEKEKRNTGGFISDETLLRAIAADFGCMIQNDDTFLPTLSLEDLVSGLRDVTVVGRVVAIFPPKAFNGIKKGKLASMLIADKSGIVRVVLWNDKANLVESGTVKAGQIIRFSHAYTREGYAGKVELQTGEKCEVEVDPQNVQGKDFPTISKFTTKIGELEHGFKGKKVNIVGKVHNVFSVSAFERQDSTLGKVMRFVLADSTGEASIVVWNEKVDELEPMLKTEARLQLIDARVKKAMGEGLEIHVDTTTYVETVAPAEDFPRIASLKEGPDDVNVQGEVVNAPIVQDVKTSRNEHVKVASFELKDETGKIWVAAWRKHADNASKLKRGDKIIVKNAYVKKGFGDQLEIATRDRTVINVSQEH